MHANLIGSQVRFLSHETPNCAGAALSTNGGTVDSNQSLVLTIHIAGEFHLCFADVLPGVRWELPTPTTNATRLRALQEARVLIDDDFEYFSHITIAVVGNLSAPPSPPAYPPTPWPIALMENLAENMNAEVEEASNWGVLVAIFLLCFLLFALFARWLRGKPKPKEQVDLGDLLDAQLKVEVDKELKDLRDGPGVEIEEVPAALERARADKAAKEAAALRKRQDEEAALARTQEAAALTLQKHARGNAARNRYRDTMDAKAAAAAVPNYMLDMGANPFVEAVRGALGVTDSFGPSDDETNDDLRRGFNSDVDDALRALFKRCDTDYSGTMGRGEFCHALQILNLDKHLALYGGERGLVVGLEQLFQDLADKETRVLHPQGFVVLFRKLNAAEEARHAQVWTRTESKRSPRSAKLRSSVVKMELMQKKTPLSSGVDAAILQMEESKHQVFGDEMAAVADRLAHPESYDLHSSPSWPNAKGRMAAVRGVAASVAAMKEAAVSDAALRQKEEYSELKSLMKQLSPSQRTFKKLPDSPTVDKSKMRQLSVEKTSRKPARSTESRVDAIGSQRDQVYWAPQPSAPAAIAPALAEPVLLSSPAPEPVVSTLDAELASASTTKSLEEDGRA